MRAFCIFADRKPEGRIFTFYFSSSDSEVTLRAYYGAGGERFLAFTRPAPRFCSYFAFVLIFCAYA